MTPIFITVLGVFVLKEAVGWRPWPAILVGLGGVGLNVALGGAVVIGSGLYILHRETTLGRKLLATRKVHPRT